MNLIKLKELFNSLKINILDFYLNNPISEIYRLEKIDRTLTILDLEKVKEMKIYHSITKDMVFIDNKNEKLNKLLENFLCVMNNNFAEEDLGNLYDNIIWVLFKRYKSNKYSGEYNPITNVVRTLKSDDIEAINHELIHMSANPYDGVSDYGGFYYTIDNYKIGYGLDEGYTELLNKRYFNSKSENVYWSQIIICEYLEEIVGQRKMEKFYLKASLFGLIKDLKKYFEIKEIQKFITAVDFVNDYDNLPVLADCEIETLYDQLEIIICFLFKGHSQKIINKNITEEQLEEEVTNYLDTLFKKLEFLPDETTIKQLDLIIQNKLNKNIKLDINRFKDKENVL